MKRSFLALAVAVGAVHASAAAPPTSAAVLAAVTRAAQGCGASVSHEPGLDEAARLYALGTPLVRATDQAWPTHAVFATGGRGASADGLAQYVGTRCADVARMTSVGVAVTGAQVAVLLAVPKVPALGDPRARGLEVLALTNAARARGAVCGGEAHAPVGALAWDERLYAASLAYASRQARLDFTGHQDAFDRSTPEERLRAAGYEGGWGENLAYGTLSPAETVQGWLDSPGHCRNLMSPRHTVMGAAWSGNPRSAYGVYWAQAFGDVR